MTNETGSILIVEDDPINRILLSTCLHEEGHTIRTAENGRQALDMLHNEHFENEFRFLAEFGGKGDR